jgi:hypothetical protein
MIKTTLVLCASGSTFSPAAAEERAGVSFSRKNEHGDLGVIGRYKGQAIPYGSADLFDMENGTDLAAPRAQFFDAIERAVPECEAAGATSIVLHINVAFSGQCNIEMSPGFIASVARLGIPLTLTCFEDETRE